MSMESECIICNVDSKEELQCSSCEYQVHYQCALGFEPLGDREHFKVFMANGKYLCPPCLVGTSYNLLHMAIDAHSKNSARTTHLQATSDRDRRAERRASTRVGSTSINSSADTVAKAQDESINGGESTGEAVTPSPPPSPSASNHPSAPPESPDHIPGTEVNSATGADVMRLRGGPTISESGDFRTKVSQSEKRRIKRFKGMLHGLRHLCDTIDTLIILDSNGRDIKGEDIDGKGDKIRVSAIGGLCVAATTSALKSSKVKYPQIKRLVYGLGTNDHLHAHEHPGDIEGYLKQLNTETRKVFPNAIISFILPFSAIQGLGEAYVKHLSTAIQKSGVGWKKLIPPNMAGKLVSPNKIHLGNQGKQSFRGWLQKLFSPIRPSAPVSVHSPLNPERNPPNSDFHPSARTYSAAVTRDTLVRGDPPIHRAFNHEMVVNEQGVENRYINNRSLNSMLAERLYELLLEPQPQRGSLNKHFNSHY